jgi:hypothetical protein
VASAVIVDLQVKADLAKYRGTLKGKAVLVTPPAAIDLAPLINGVPRLTQEELEARERTVIAPARVPAPRVVRHPDLLTAEEKVAFYASEGVAAVLQSESGWLGAVRGFSRPGSRADGWSRAGMLASPRRTIRVALWAGEEQGLFGSRAYVKRHFGDPRDPAVGVTPAYEKFSAYFNQDYGAGQYRGIMLQGNEFARTRFTAWMAPFHDFGMTVVSNQSLGSTDHVAFDEVGLPGFQFLQDRIPGTGGHTNLDFLDTIQPADLMKNAVIMASFAYHAANANSRVPRKTAR